MVSAASQQKHEKQEHASTATETAAAAFLISESPLTHAYPYRLWAKWQTV